MKSWFTTLSDDKLQQEEIFSFLGDANGLKFLMARMQNIKSENPYFAKIQKSTEPNTKMLQRTQSFGKEDSSEESGADSEGDDVNEEVLKFVGSRVGLRLTKKDSISTQIVLKKNDHELLQAAKVVTQMRRQQAIFNRSPTKEFGLSTMGQAKNRKTLQSQDDNESMEALMSLTERNFAMSIQLLDCSMGQAETDKLKTSIWSMSKFKTNIAAQIFIEPGKQIKNEYYLTFDLGQVVQVTEAQISFTLCNDVYG